MFALGFPIAEPNEFASLTSIHDNADSSRQG